MLKVGLTGGIACGKTLVRHELERLGAATLDADELSRQAVEPGTPAFGKIVEAFGERVISPEGVLDRQALGSIVFSDNRARELLNSIVHPAVIRRQDDWLQEMARVQTRVAVVDAALMIETGSYKRYQRIIVVFCSPRQQVERLMQRDGIGADAAQRRVDSQMPIAEKRAYADFLIDNGGSRRRTLGQTRVVYQKLLSESDPLG